MKQKQEKTVAGRVHICAGGTLDVLPNAMPGDILIGVDAGALRLLEAGAVPTLAVGDFDTIGEAGLSKLVRSGVEIRRFPERKDATDSDIGLQAALSFQPKEIFMYGALGGRMDHSLANVQLLWQAHQAGVWMQIESGDNRIALLSERFRRCRLTRDHYQYVSLLPLSPLVTGITLEGFAYPLHDARLELGSTLGVSNQLTGEAGRIQIESGALLVMSTRDAGGRQDEKLEKNPGSAG
ncbi:thiamine diphosphokinase [Brevibacillus sp. B_LB10_24]|uniref:thiamine diphosphokinase n=1 Tax=Brevibacillus sp. B_LB10_24 TaxID=3380645 RepID=UPI0038B7C27E